MTPTADGGYDVPATTRAPTAERAMPAPAGALAPAVAPHHAHERAHGSNLATRALEAKEEPTTVASRLLGKAQVLNARLARENERLLSVLSHLEGMEGSDVETGPRPVAAGVLHELEQQLDDLSIQLDATEGRVNILSGL